MHYFTFADKDTTKWRSVIGAGFIGLFVKHIYDMFS